MATHSKRHKNICPKCGSPLSDSMRHCNTCATDVGAPNVRRCDTSMNLKALTNRFKASRIQATANGCLKEFSNLEVVLKDKSGVVVSMTGRVARKLFEDPNTLYTNYERLVGGGVRKPADSENDRCRCAIAGVLFGSYANSIIYGALSLTGTGLPTYGSVHCRLRSVTIDKRTSFLETNSYKFVKEHQIDPGGSLPAGYMASWEYRYKLALAKFVDRLSTGQTESDWQTILVQSDGQNRDNDNFVEAHIFEGFDKNAVESMVAFSDKKLSREEKLDLDIAMNKFKCFRGKTI